MVMIAAVVMMTITSRGKGTEGQKQRWVGERTLKKERRQVERINEERNPILCTHIFTYKTTQTLFLFLFLTRKLLFCMPCMYI